MSGNGQNSTFSIDKIRNQVSEASARINAHAESIQTLARGIEAVDVATVRYLSHRTIDDQQELIAAARALASLLNGGAL